MTRSTASAATILLVGAPATTFCCLGAIGMTGLAWRQWHDAITGRPGDDTIEGGPDN